ncbi:type IV conjugative transfer system lipoprotein TraV [Photobacterium damselae]|uniref:Conjugal transfer protein TraV n=1 Tax=Photobacterium damselae TaxID=38293 RepID=A0A2T3Q8D9_PHODM|nr:type IV conjugative transfer system lipoprotein TraV [Photobacterium damselae]PSW80306.1 type IV conjugative transfer system protein TraV [Photobacterium damselae]SPY45155.1 conjugal transfer protein TraV [Photobacterium damselae]
MKILLPIATVLLLSGCAAGMNEDFSCSGIDGISGCVSMTDLNSMVDDGQFNTDSQGNLIANKTAPTTAVANAQSITAINPPPMSGQPFRAQEDVRQITIFPFIDEMGNYHDTAVIYTIVSPTSWRTRPIMPPSLPTHP